jgi:hypothetical protein
LLTLADAFGGCCDAYCEVVAEAWRTCLVLALFGADFDGCAVAGVEGDLLLEDLACGFAKVTPFEARFGRMCSMVETQVSMDR